MVVTIKSSDIFLIQLHTRKRLEYLKYDKRCIVSIFDYIFIFKVPPE